MRRRRSRKYISAGVQTDAVDRTRPNGMRRPTVLLADDHVVFTDGIVRILKAYFDVVGTAPDGRALLESADRLRPDVIVTDVTMPAMTGVEGLRQLRANGINSRVIFLTMHADPQIAAEVFRLGASGFVLKHSSGDELVNAIEEVLQGHRYMSPALADDISTLLSRPAEAAAPELSSRQKAVLQLIVNGRRMKEIAAHLKLSPRLVETIKHEMMRDLNVDSTTGLVRYAIEHHLV
jgi:DNA-binding NarL/FixJ family response regulator